MGEWRLRGKLVHACSCKMLCPCYFGPAEPDEGWCSGLFAFDVEDGDCDGADLAGSRVAWAIELPKDFFSGNGTARLYVDSPAPKTVHDLFTGRKGGVFELAAAMVSHWLPGAEAPITIDTGEEPSVKVGEVGSFSFRRLRTEDGRQTRLSDALALARFKLGASDLALTEGEWSDPGMRGWSSGGSGSVTSFDWTG